MPSLVDEYVESKITTATPHQLHLMLIDGAILNAVAAERAFSQGHVDVAHAALVSAGQYVSQMISGLDATRAPQIVENVERLFLFIHNNLFRAGRERSVAPLADALTILRMYRETWLALGEALKGEAALEPPSHSETRFSWTS